MWIVNTMYCPTDCIVRYGVILWAHMQIGYNQKWQLRGFGFVTSIALNRTMADRDYVWGEFIIV